MKQAIIITLLVFVALLLLIGMKLGYSLHPDAPTINITSVPTPRTSSSPTPTTDNSHDANPTTSITAMPQANEQNIKIFSPRNNDTVGDTFTISGEARVFENSFLLRITDTTTKEVLYGAPVRSNAPDAGLFGSYSESVHLAGSNIRSGDVILIEAYQASPKDGTEIDKVNVRVIYK